MIDLFPYSGKFEPPLLPSFIFADTSFTSVSHTPITALKPLDDILDIMDDEFVTSDSGGYRCFLVQYKDRPSTNDA